MVNAVFRRLDIVFLVGCIVLGVPGSAAAKTTEPSKAPTATRGHARGSSPEPTSCLVPADEHTIELPLTKHKGLTVEEAIGARRTTRRYARTPISLANLARILWAAQGITDPKTGKRAAPSAGRAYPIELYVVPNDVQGIGCGVYVYRPAKSRLELVKEGSFREAIYVAALKQPWVYDAGAVLVFVATPAKIAVKYGKRAAVPETLLEAGHISENVYLEATSLGLGAAAIGGFRSRRVDELLGLAKGKYAVYLNLVGNRM